MVGFVTEIETENGIVKTADIDADLRSEWSRKLANKIEDIDGVSEAHVSSLAKATNNQVGTIEVIVNSKDYDSSVELFINPRSFSPRLRSVVEEYAQVSSFEIGHTPTPVNAEQNLYDTNYYIVSFHFY